MTWAIYPCPKAAQPYSGWAATLLLLLSGTVSCERQSNTETQPSAASASVLAASSAQVLSAVATASGAPVGVNVNPKASGKAASTQPVPLPEGAVSGGAQPVPAQQSSGKAARLPTPCRSFGDSVLRLPPTWWLDPGAHVEGGRSRDLAFDTDATGSRFWLISESTQSIREYRGNELQRTLGPIPDGAVDLRSVGEDRFALLYAEPPQVIVYDVKTNQQTVSPAMNVTAEDFLALTKEGIHQASLQRSQWVASPTARRWRASGIAGLPEPKGEAVWRVDLLRGREVLVTMSAPEPKKATPIDLGGGEWTRRGLVFDGARQPTLLLSRAEPATKERVEQYEALYAMPLTAEGNARLPAAPLTALSESEFAPPIRRPVIALEDGSLLQLVSDQRGTSVVRWRKEALGSGTCPKVMESVPESSALANLPSSSLKDGEAAGCSARRQGDWLMLRCTADAGSGATQISIEDPFNQSYRSRITSGSDVLVETNGLVERVSRTAADEPRKVDFAELIVKFTRGTHIQGNLEGPSGTRRFELNWPSNEVQPSQVGLLRSAKPRGQAAGDH
jgi:hypothetical protein